MPDLRQVVAREPEAISVIGTGGEYHLEREHHHAVSDALHLAQAGNGVPGSIVDVRFFQAAGNLNFGRTDESRFVPPS